MNAKKRIDEKKRQYDTLMKNIAAGVLPGEVLVDIGQQMKELKAEIAALEMCIRDRYRTAAPRQRRALLPLEITRETSGNIRRKKQLSMTLTERAVSRKTHFLKG